MDQLAYDRWLEISFYYFCTDILRINNDIMDAMALVEALAPIANYDIIPAKALVQEILVTYQLRPNQEEIALLMHKRGFTFREIKQTIKMGSDKITYLIADDKINPRMFYPRLSSKKLEIMKKILATIDIIGKAGFPHDRA